MRLTCATITALLLVGAVTTTTAEAQELPLTIQGGFSYGYPLGDFASTDGDLDPDVTSGFATPGTNLKIRAIFQLSDKIGIYAEIYRPEFGGDIGAVLERLGLSGTGYDASWKLNIFGFGARITPLKIAMAAPYIQAGIGRYQSEIWQKRVSVEETDESDVGQGYSFGLGTTLMFGRFGVDIGAQYHTLEFIFDGQPIGWQATWLDFNALLTFDLGG